MGKLRVYCLKTLNKLLIYPLGNTPSAPSVSSVIRLPVQPLQLQVGGMLVPADLSLRQITKTTGLVENNSPQGPSVLHSQLKSRVPLLLTSVVSDDAATEGGTLVRIKVVTRELATGHTTDGVDKVATV